MAKPGKNLALSKEQSQLIYNVIGQVLSKELPPGNTFKVENNRLCDVDNFSLHVILQNAITDLLGEA